MSRILESLYEAQKIAFAPFIFKAAAAALKTGFLKGAVEEKSPVDAKEWAKRLQLTEYAVEVMADILVSAGVLNRDEAGRLTSTTVGDLLVLDEMTRANFFFTEDVNYEGLAHTLDALLEGRPAGLSAFNKDWVTIYPHLPELPEAAKKSWFAFDHFHSDRAYEAALDVLADFEPRHLVDIGGNTGRFTRRFLERNPGAKATFVDLPVEVDALSSRPELAHVISRIDAVAIDWLTPAELKGTQEADLYWMSQFLDCFSFDEARSILERTRRAMKKGARLAVLEPIVDEQRHKAAELSVAATSLYFTVMANGNSRFFSGADLRRLFEAAGFAVEREAPNMGISHTLFVLTPQSCE